VFTAPQEARREIEALSAALRLPLTQVGSIQPGEAKLQVLDALGKPLAVPRGYDHFA
jgi:thiamine monophosphate kinase